MTIIVALANRETAILLADRRISNEGHIVDDEYNKLIVLCCHDAKVALAFTGLARMPGLDMTDWLTECLLKIEKAGVRTLAETISGLKDHLDHLFRSIQGEHKLTVVICGFVYWNDVPEPCIYKISNFEFNDHAQRDFILGSVCGSPDGSVEVAGASSGLPQETLQRLRSLLERKVPRQSLVRFAVRHLQSAARKHQSLGTVGERCNAAVIQAARDTPITSTYHVPKGARQAFGCNVVIYEGLFCYGVDIMAPQILAGGEIRKNDPCWCGSGQPFKHCHLKKFGAVEVAAQAWKRPLNWVVEIERNDPVPSGRLFRIQSGFS